MRLRLFQVDAFTDRVFGGNPAAVVPLDAWLPDQTLQAIALENNLSETAFFVGDSDAETDFHLRWFTPAIEVDLCGHATVAAAHVLFTHLDWQRSDVRFKTQSGLVSCRSETGRLVLDFPARPGKPADLTQEIVNALGGSPVEVRVADNLLVVYSSEGELVSLTPDAKKVAALDAPGVIVTAPADADDVDFVSRFFAPRAGIDEDPVTGSAHCMLAPYWAERLGKRDLHARQISSRGGELFCRHRPDDGRVDIAGRAVTFLQGTIQL